MAEFPADLAIKYESREGSVPPPYYFQYTLTVDARGAAELVFQPDYDFNHPPTWRVAFSVPRERLAPLYELFRSRGVLGRTWNAVGPPAVGGRTQTVEITASGVHTSIPANPPPDSAALAREVFTAIEGLVSDETWRDLRQRRNAYQGSYVKRK